ncbi:MAG TPA: hypothetical protein VI248_00230 [Kineosporiaceae bacterium]
MRLGESDRSQNGTTQREAWPGDDLGGAGEPGGDADDGAGADGGRPALLLPGRAYGPQFPLLYYARRCLADAGRHVQALEWPSGELAPGCVVRMLQEAVDRLPDGPRDLVLLAKSTGTHAIPWAAEHGVPGIWLTPLLQVPAVRAALPSLPAGSLLVGGTADPTWDGEVAAASGLPVLQLEGADHNLELPGHVHRSLAALARVVTAVSDTLSPSIREDLTPARGLSLR